MKECCETCRFWHPTFFAGKPNNYFGHCHAMKILPEGSRTIIRNGTQFYTGAVDQCEPSHWKAKPEPKPSKRRKR